MSLSYPLSLYPPPPPRTHTDTHTHTKEHANAHVFSYVHTRERASNSVSCPCIHSVSHLTHIHSTHLHRSGSQAQDARAQVLGCVGHKAVHKHSVRVQATGMMRFIQDPHSCVVHLRSEKWGNAQVHLHGNRTKQAVMPMCSSSQAFAHAVARPFGFQHPYCEGVQRRALPTPASG